MACRVPVSVAWLLSLQYCSERPTVCMNDEHGKGWVEMGRLLYLHI